DGYPERHAVGDVQRDRRAVAHRDGQTIHDARRGRRPATRHRGFGLGAGGSGWSAGGARLRDTLREEPARADALRGLTSRATPRWSGRSPPGGRPLEFTQRMLCDIIIVARGTETKRGRD